MKASKSYLDLIKDVPVARTKPQSVYNPLNILQKAKVKIKERQQEKLASKQLNVQKSNTILKSFLKLNLSQKQSQNQKQNKKQQQSSFTNLASLLGLASINIPRPTSNLKGPDFTIRDLGRLDKGKTDKPTERSFFYKPKTAYKSSKGKIIQQGEVYVVFARVYGEDTMIGSAYSLEEAKDILRNYLTSNLRASGFVKKKGGEDKLDVFLGFGFRPSKRERGRVVQESWFRLGSQWERSEIKRARMNNLNWFSGNRNKRFRWF